MIPPKQLAPTGYVQVADDTLDAFRERMMKYAIRATPPKSKWSLVQTPKQPTHAARLCSCDAWNANECLCGAWDQTHAAGAK